MEAAAVSSTPPEGSSSSSEGDHGQETKVSMQTVKENLSNLVELRQLHKERLARIEDELTKLQKYRKDYEHLLKRLKALPDKVSHEVMVPFGPLAFVPGHLVHTNEILVLLGDNWFAERSTKQAVEIVRRRLKDCDEKIETAENTRKVHNSWIQEAEEVLSGDTSEQVEIVEELTEEEFKRSEEEHKRKVSKHYTQLREMRKQAQCENQNPDIAAGTSSASVVTTPAYLQDGFCDTLGEQDRRTYDDIMRRLDQLELQEEEGSIDSEDSEDEDGDNLEEICESEEGDAHAKSKTSEVSEEGESSSIPVILPKKPKLKRRVSWADDIRPLHTVIPDNDSTEIYRIQYSSGLLSMPLTGAIPFVAEAEAEATVADDSEKEVDVTNSSEKTIQSPSDIYKVFGYVASGPEPQPRGILKKTTSLPLQGSSSETEEGWCCPPKPLDIEAESPEDLPPPPPSPPPRRAQSLKPAFSYRVLERRTTTESGNESSNPSSTALLSGNTDSPSSSVNTDDPPKKVSKFKAARMRK